MGTPLLPASTLAAVLTLNVLSCIRRVEIVSACFLIAVSRGFVGVCTVHQPFAGHAGHDPGELEYLGHIRLFVEDHPVGSSPAASRVAATERV